MKISVQREDFDLSREVKLISGKTAVGAVASFVGLVREVPMTLEHYPGMTERAIAAIVEEARGRWAVMDCTVIHRYGALAAGDQMTGLGPLWSGSGQPPARGAQSSTSDSAWPASRR